jgi:hypothetical protein
VVRQTQDRCSGAAASEIPIFAAIPVAGLASAGVAARRRDYDWATYSAGSTLLMVGSFVLVRRAFGGVPRFAGEGGLFQRIFPTCRTA